MTKSYQEITDNLNTHIKEVRTILDLIEELKSTKRIATEEELLFLKGKARIKDHEWSIETGTPLCGEEIALILETKSRDDKKSGMHYQPILIDSHENLDQLRTVVENNLKYKIPFHYDIILQGLGVEFESATLHCTPLQMNFDGQKLRSFFIDAAGVDENVMAIAILNTQRDQVVDSGKFFKPDPSSTLQQDRISCAIFSIQDLNTMYKLTNNLTRYLLGNNGALVDLHPRFVKNAQSTSLLKKYSAQSQNKNLTVSKDKNLDEYISNYSVSIELADSTKITQNRAIDYKKLKYLEEAKKLLEKTYQAGGEQAVQRLLEQRMGGIIFDQHRKQQTGRQEVKNTTLSAVEKLEASRSGSKTSSLAR